METIEDLKWRLLAFGLNCRIESKYDRIKKDSPNWGWHLIVIKGNQYKVFQLWKYGGKREKLIKEFLKFVRENEQQQILFA